MSDPEIINTTRYDTDDVVKILTRVAHEKEWTSIRIRYLMKPRELDGHSDWAAVHYEQWKQDCTKIELALLKPEKIPVSPLIQLAQCADAQEWAQPKVVEHLCYTLKTSLRTDAVGLATLKMIIDTSKIKLTEKPNQRTKRLSAYRNFEDKVTSAANSLRYAEQARWRAKKRLATAERALAESEEKVPKYKDRVAKLREQLRKKWLKLPKDLQHEIAERNR